MNHDREELKRCFLALCLSVQTLGRLTWLIPLSILKIAECSLRVGWCALREAVQR